MQIIKWISECSLDEPSEQKLSRYFAKSSLMLTISNTVFLSAGYHATEADMCCNTNNTIKTGFTAIVIIMTFTLLLCFGPCGLEHCFNECWHILMIF